MLRVSIIGESVEFIYCACGCQKTLSKYRIRNGRPVKSEPRYYIQWHRVRNDQYGKKNSYYKNGTKVDPRGYRWVLARDHPFHRNGYVREHRYLFEKYHNCCLLPWASVHHKNGIKSDNSKGNLDGMMEYQHKLLHAMR